MEKGKLGGGEIVQQFISASAIMCAIFKDTDRAR
jgi:hypothetical protein